VIFPLLPVVVHISPVAREETTQEVEAVSREVGTDITIGTEGIRLEI